jgi:hypothetical protein
MRLIFFIVLGVFFVCYAWGWFIHVHNQFMTISDYNHYYIEGVRTFFEGAMDTISKWTAAFFKPGERHMESLIY